jgi:hypothetical protein
MTATQQSRFAAIRGSPSPWPGLRLVTHRVACANVGTRFPAASLRARPATPESCMRPLPTENASHRPWTRAALRGARQAFDRLNALDNQFAHALTVVSEDVEPQRLVRAARRVAELLRDAAGRHDEPEEQRAAQRILQRLSEKPPPADSACEHGARAAPNAPAPVSCASCRCRLEPQPSPAQPESASQSSPHRCDARPDVTPPVYQNWSRPTGTRFSL